MKLFTKIFFCVILIFSVFSSESEPTISEGDREVLDAFKSDLKNCSMEMNIPNGFVEVPLYERTFMYGYQYALNYTKGKLEFRFIVENMHAVLQQFKESLDNPEMVLFDPNRGIVQELSIFAQGIIDQGRQKPQIYKFEKSKLKKFGATNAFVTEQFVVTQKFTGEYEWTFVQMLHKDDVCKLYMVVMFDDFREFAGLWEEAQYTIVFK